MERLAAVSGLVVGQQKEWGEILTGFETANRYAVSDASGAPLYQAAEEAGNLLLRWFLKALRPFKLRVIDDDHQTVVQVDRPFRFFFHRAEISDGQGQPLGAIQRRFAILRRVYSVLDASGNEVLELFGPILHPWTFQIRQNGVEQGKITKKWSGLMKEGFTDADNFGVVFPADWEVKLKAVLLGAVFLIDFAHFENRGNQ